MFTNKTSWRRSQGYPYVTLRDKIVAARNTTKEDVFLQLTKEISNVRNSLERVYLLNFLEHIKIEWTLDQLDYCVIGDRDLKEVLNNFN